MLEFLFGNCIKKLVASKVQNQVDMQMRVLRVENEALVEQTCVNLVSSMFKEDAPEEGYQTYGWVNGGYYSKTGKGMLHEDIAKKVVTTLEEQEKERVEGYLNGEDFIDKIIDRVNRKQIK